MVSRRKILSRSRDELDNIKDLVDDDEDAWYSKDTFYKDHIQEVLQKWQQLDDEIWSKIICMERNRRIAKAYARAEELTINGSEEGFNGYRIGLNGFDNPMRDAKTAEVKRYIGNGIKMKMDDNGNILVKRSSRSSVYVMDTDNIKNDTAVSSDIVKNEGQIQPNKVMKLFDMKKFQNNIEKELRQAYPDRKRLEYQCVVPICFVRRNGNLLDCPCWVMIMNVVALDMLKRKLPTAPKLGGDRKIYSRPRLPIPFEEDPYSLPGNGNSNNNNNGIYGRLPQQTKDPKPPKLPPRDFKSKNRMTFPEPDYEDDNDNNGKARKKSSPIRKLSKIEDEDPYYCGMSARVPNYEKKKPPKHYQERDIYSRGYNHKNDGKSAKRNDYDIYSYASRKPSYLDQMPYSMYGTHQYRSVDSLIDTHSRKEGMYTHIYGSRLRMPTTNVASSRANAYVGNWE